MEREMGRRDKRGENVWKGRGEKERRGKSRRGPTSTRREGLTTVPLSTNSFPFRRLCIMHSCHFLTERKHSFSANLSNNTQWRFVALSRDPTQPQARILTSQHMRSVWRSIKRLHAALSKTICDDDGGGHIHKCVNTLHINIHRMHISIYVYRMNMHTIQL